MKTPPAIDKEDPFYRELFPERVVIKEVVKEVPVVKDPPAKNCLSCAHRQSEKCVLTGWRWDIQRKYPNSICDERLSGWKSTVPLPPRRSLAQWIYDTFFKLNK